MPAVNERVRYVSPYRYGEFDATITAVNPDGTVAIAVYIDGLATGRRDGRDLAEPVVTLRSVSYGAHGLARPVQGQG